jgi:hypothetical protein
MKFLILCLFTVFATAIANASFPSPKSCNAIGKSELLRGGGDVWPWGEEMPFPWKGIQGVWMAEIDGCSSYFTFTTLKMDSGINQLRVKQFDMETCKLISRGVGYEQDRYVKAVLTGRRGTFDITVHVFRNTPSKSSPRQDYFESKTATVLSLGDFSENNEPKSYQLYKVATDPESICPSTAAKY